jgi:hypothetical protein
LALLTVDRANVDDAAPTARAHAFDHLARHVETRIHIDADHFRPLLMAHLVEEAVAGDAGIVHEHVDRPEFGFDSLSSFHAIVEIADIALHDHDVEFLGGCVGGLLIAGITGRDLHAIRLQPRSDRFADASGAASYKCHARHECLPVSSAAKSEITLRELARKRQAASP